MKSRYYKTTVIEQLKKVINQFVSDMPLPMKFIPRRRQGTSSSRIDHAGLSVLYLTWEGTSHGEGYSDLHDASVDIW